MRDDNLYLSDILDAAAEIASFIRRTTRQQFLADRKLQLAVLQLLTVIGEATYATSRALRSRHPEIPWADIIAFRHIAIHAYFAINWELVWVAATKDSPMLAVQIQSVLDNEPEAPK